jgi:hypothetical protein
MQNGQLWRRKRIQRRGAVIVALAVAGLVLGAMALGAAGKPSMQVLPSPKGLKYSQTVRVKAQNLPKGSGTIALTICGLTNARGAKIANVTADDCAGQNDLSSGLVKLQQWKDGTFDQQYKLPKSGQKFGKNQRFCDAKHYCALVVADANPDKPAYHVDTNIYFTDQQGSTATTKPRTATTKPKPRPTTTTTTRPTVSFNAGGNASAGSSGGSGSVHASVEVNAPKTTTPPTTPPTAPEVAVPAPVADAIEQGGGDASALTVACSTLVNGGGGAQLGVLLQSPSFACVAVASAAQGSEQLADACSQLATALQPYSSQLGDALNPALGLLP